MGLTFQINTPSKDDVRDGLYNKKNESIDDILLKHKSYSVGLLVNYKMQNQTILRFRFGVTRNLDEANFNFDHYYGIAIVVPGKGTQTKYHFAPGIVWIIIDSKTKFSLYGGFEIPINLHGVESSYYLFYAGDTVAFAYNGGIPYAKVLNRETLPYDTNCDIIIDSVITKHEVPISYKYAAPYLFGNINPSNQKKVDLYRDSCLGIIKRQLADKFKLLDSFYHEQVSVFQVHPINAESILVSSAPSVQVCLELAVKFDVSLSSSRLVEIADSQRAVRCIFAAQQLELNNISPRDIRFYYHLFAANSRELPALS